MNKPRITYDTEFERYFCMIDRQDLHSWPVVGWGDTPKEAFTDWYCRLLDKALL